MEGEIGEIRQVFDGRKPYWLIMNTIQIANAAVEGRLREEFGFCPHFSVFTFAPDSNPNSLHFQFYVGIADIPDWLASTTGPLASITRKGFVWSGLHRPPERKALSRHHCEDADDELPDGPSRCQRIRS